MVSSKIYANLAISVAICLNLVQVSQGFSSSSLSVSSREGLHRTAPTYHRFQVLRAATLTQEAVNIQAQDEVMEINILKSSEALGLKLETADGVVTLDCFRPTAIQEVTEKLKVGDQVLKVNGLAYSTDIEMARAIRDVTVGQKLTFTIVRPAVQEEAVSKPVEKVKAPEPMATEDTEEVEERVQLLRPPVYRGEL
mmetsp:Transcript_18150/g.23884  ORF Transcript_18150/g.23884 Transcript_18150/m.23884 type:complete len:196 (+) Transcript_18150:78-665(+)